MSYNYRSATFAGRRGRSGGRNFNPQYRGYRGRQNRAPKAANINPSRFVNKAKPLQEVEVFTPKHAFGDFKLNPQLFANIQAADYTEPTRIQDLAIPAILKGEDIVGLADTGSGKTAAFVIPAIQRLLEKPGSQMLVIAPVRELAAQIQDQFYMLTKNLRLYTAVCVGGRPISSQIHALRRRPQIVIGTPGRLKDLLKRGVLNLSSTNLLVLDEIDRMLDMGFIGDIKTISGQLPTQRQSLGFSATTTPAVNSLISQVLNNPQTISVRTSVSSEHIQQDILEVYGEEAKLETLSKLLGQDEFKKVLIFGQTKHGVNQLAQNLNNLGHRSESIHGNKNQGQRQRALNAFKQNSVSVLVATDVAARGLDIPHVSHVINYDLPQSYGDYTHRIGRTGRIGRPGSAITFIKPVSHRF